MTNSVQLIFVSSRYGRKGRPSFEVTSDEWPASVTRWLWPAMEQYAARLRLVHINLTEWDSLKFAIPGLAQVASWEGFTQIPIKDLEIEDVRDLFMEIDETFHYLWGDDRGALRSSRVRRFLLDYLLSLRPDGALQRVRRSFTPRGRKNYQPRRLISDQVSRRKDGTLDPPIDALPHQNAAELKRLTKARLISDLEQIAIACKTELALYFTACERLYMLRSAPIDVQAQATALKKLRVSTGRVVEVVESMSARERKALTAHYLRLDNEPSAEFATPDYLGSRALGADLARALGVEPDTFLRCARFQYYPHQTVLVAAILLIQLATAWNVSSVMELTVDGIQQLDGADRFLIKSIKTKTRDDTPFVLIEGEEEPAVVALRFVVGRLRALQARGWASAGETGLWLSPRSNYEKSRGLPVSNLSKGLDALRAKYDLSKFTFEQVRVQKLTVVSLEKGPVAAAEVAGHSFFGSIGGYIDHLLTRRVNSSINLEFQRRWEAEVLSHIRREEITAPLVAIGDGSSCVAPQSPPEPTWLHAGVCDGTHCHSGASGCPNRVLVVDADRVTEVLLTKDYYERNWQRLYANNPEAFSAVHLPRMEFNIYLHEHLKSGPYRHLLNGQA